MPGHRSLPGASHRSVTVHPEPLSFSPLKIPQGILEPKKTQIGTAFMSFASFYLSHAFFFSHEDVVLPKPACSVAQRQPSGSPIKRILQRISVIAEATI